jgi:N-acetylmuramoyl-L-alanine amidase
MVDKIIETTNNIESLFNDVIKLNNPRILFLFYYYHPNFKIDEIVDKMIELNNPRYLSFLLGRIEPLYYDKILNKLLKYDDAKIIYYAYFDAIKLDNNQQFQILNRLIELNEKSYILRFIYNYFYINKNYNEKIFRTTIDFFNKNNLETNNLTKDNIDDFVLKIYEKESSKIFDSKAINGYSNKCHKGRKDYIPDLIVCHVTNNYNKALKNYFDDTSDVSSHFLISNKGEIKEIVSLDNSAWGNGTSLNPDSDVYYKFSKSKIIKERADNANYYTFSIENESYDGSLSKEQYKATIKCFKKIIKYLKNKYNYDFIIDRNHILGHDEVNPIVRISCPGRNFPFNKIIEDLKSNY